MCQPTAKLCDTKITSEEEEEEKEQEEELESMKNAPFVVKNARSGGIFVLCGDVEACSPLTQRRAQRAHTVKPTSRHGRGRQDCTTQLSYCTSSARSTYPEVKYSAQLFFRRRERDRKRGGNASSLLETVMRDRDEEFPSFFSGSHD